MSLKKERLLEFIKKYGEDFLEYPEKDRLIKRLEKADDDFTINLIQSLDKQWVERVMRVGRFVTFADYIRPSRRIAGIPNDFYSAGYIDNGNTGERRIPVLRHVIVRDRERSYRKDKEYYDFEI